MMATYDGIPPDFGLEVPFISDDICSTTTVINIDGGSTVDGVPLFEFPTASCAGTSQAIFASADTEAVEPWNDNRMLVWSMEDSDPKTIYLRDVSFMGKDSVEDVVQLVFPASILPSVCSVTEDGNNHRVFVLTSDGFLHVVRAFTNVEGGNSLRTQFLDATRTGASAIQSLSIRDELERGGAPTCMAYIDGTLCIGTSEGKILCLPVSEDISSESVFELNPFGGMLGSINGVLSGILGKRSIGRVEQMLPMTFVGETYLCSIYSGSLLRIWDLSSRRVLIANELLPAGPAETTFASLLRGIVEPVDASTSLLILVFRSLERDVSISDKLVMFEIFSEERGGVQKFHVESGPRLEGIAQRVHDVVPQHYGRDKLTIWLLYDDLKGDRKLDCIPVDFQGGQSTVPMEVQLLEDQIITLLSDNHEMNSEALLGVSKALKDIMPQVDVENSFSDILFAAGRFYKKSLEHAILNTNESVEDLDIDFGNITQKQLNDFVSQSSENIAGSSDGFFNVWKNIFNSYASSITMQHLPIGILPGVGPQKKILAVARKKNLLSFVVPAEPAECLRKNKIPFIWKASIDAPSLAKTELNCVIEAMNIIITALGGQAILPMIRRCLVEDTNKREEIFDAVVSVLFSSPYKRRGASKRDEKYDSWQSYCRCIPLKLGEVVKKAESLEKFLKGLQIMIHLLGQCCFEIKRIGGLSSSTSTPKCLSSSAVSRAQQLAAAQLDCIICLKLLIKFIGKVPSLGWIPLRGSIHETLAATDVARINPMLSASQIAYWTTTYPCISCGLNQGQGIDKVNFAFSLNIGDRAEESGTLKRARVAPALGRGAYVAEHLMSVYRSFGPNSVHDTLFFVTNFSRWLISIEYCDILEPDSIVNPEMATARALDISDQLLRLRLLDVFPRLFNQILIDQVRDARLLFLMGINLAYKASISTDPDVATDFEEKSVSILFQVASLYLLEEDFPVEISDIQQSLKYISATYESRINSKTSSIDKLITYYEILMDMFGRFKLPGAASRLSLAAAKNVVEFLSGDQNSESRAHHAGRLWSTIFDNYIQSEAWEEAYSALLGNEAAELQIDCVHRIVNKLSKKGQVAALCSLPFAHTSVIFRAGQPEWISLLDEAVLALQRRATNLQLDVHPQPYKVLFSFYSSRNNHQGAAASMLVYARRLLSEKANDVSAMKEAKEALAISAASLSLVPEEHAWIEDPMPSLKQNGEPVVLSLSDLKKEHALAHARFVLASRASLTSGWHGVGIDDIILQLLEQGLYKFYG